MATNSYAVPPNFPSGLNIDLLAQEMPTVWPADLLPASYSADGRPGEPNGITTGILEIETQRALTVSENDAALAHFLTHAGGTARPGTRLVDLAPPGQGAQGRWQYVVDAPQQGAGSGAMLYDDGVNWRRGTDGAIIV